MVRGLRRAAASLAAALVTCAAVAWGSAAPVAYAGTGTAETYLVLYSAQALPGDAAARVQAAGGSVVASYPEIGVVVARSAATSFTAQVESDGRVSGVSATGAFASGLKQREPAASEDAGGTPAPSLADRQWDMAQIHATDPLACPPAPFEPAELGPDGQPAHCSGLPGHDSFYGHGQINALAAVTTSHDD